VGGVSGLLSESTGKRYFPKSPRWKSVITLAAKSFSCAASGVPAVLVTGPPRVNFAVFSDGVIRTDVKLADVSFAIAKLVPGTNEVSHTEDWAADGDGYSADIAIEIKGVPVKISGTKSLQPEKGGCRVEWKFDVTSGIPLLGGIIASFAGSEVEQKLENEFRILKSLA
jgi:hypothetical protein